MTDREPCDLHRDVLRTGAREGSAVSGFDYFTATREEMLAHMQQSLDRMYAEDAESPNEVVRLWANAQRPTATYQRAETVRAYMVDDRRIPGTPCSFMRVEYSDPKEGLKVAIDLYHEMRKKILSDEESP